MTGKIDCEALMNAMLPFAEKTLGKHGEFFPYGGAMLPNGEIAYVSTYDGRERPPSSDIIRSIKGVFVSGANDGSYKATALVYDVSITAPDGRRKQDAVAVSLNHQDGYSVVVLFPYTFGKDDVVFDSPLAQTGEADIFYVP